MTDNLIELKKIITDALNNKLLTSIKNYDNPVNIDTITQTDNAIDVILKNKLCPNIMTTHTDLNYNIWIALMNKFKKVILSCNHTDCSNDCVDLKMYEPEYTFLKTSLTNYITQNNIIININNNINNTTINNINSSDDDQLICTDLLYHPDFEINYLIQFSITDILNDRSISSICELLKKLFVTDFLFIGRWYIFDTHYWIPNNDDYSVMEYILKKY
jgi:hypothetical protein